MYTHFIQIFTSILHTCTVHYNIYAMLNKEMYILYNVSVLKKYMYVHDYTFALLILSYSMICESSSVVWKGD